MKSTYLAFCLEIHNDLSVLEKKHILYDDKEIPNVAIFKDRNELDKEMFLSSSIGTLRLATEEIAEHLGIKGEDKIVDLLNRFKQLQSNVKNFIRK